MSPPCIAWVGEGAAEGHFAPTYVPSAGELQSPQQMNNREIRL